VQQLQIRPARISDRDTLVQGNQSLARETEGLELDRQIVAMGVEHLMHHPELGQYWIAENDRGILGQCMITTEWSDWRNAPMWWFQSVYVWPSARRQGVFRQLHQHVVTQARAQGVAELRLYVEKDNKVAQSTYQALGLAGGHYEVFEQTLGQS